MTFPVLGPEAHGGLRDMKVTKNSVISVRSLGWVWKYLRQDSQRQELGHRPQQGGPQKQR